MTLLIAGRRPPGAVTFALISTTNPGNKVNILILVLMILQMPWNFFGFRGHADADTDSSVNDADVADVYAFDIAGV